MGRPWHTGELEPASLENVDGIDTGAVLARWWTERESDLPGADSALPFGAWPGLASPGAMVRAVDALQHAVAFASSAAGPKLLTGREDGGLPWPGAGP
jgi:hypothetical protein